MILLDSIEFMETETLVKRVALALGIVIISAATAGVVWYNLNLKDEFVEGKTETNYLRQETSRLSANTDTLKSDVEVKAKELKNSILANKDFTEKVGSEVKQNQLFTKEIQQEQSKFRNETKIELFKLNDQLTTKEQELRNEIIQIQNEYEKFRKDFKTENDRLKESIAVLNNQIKSKDSEILELSKKLNKEIEFRNRFFINR